VDENLNCVDHSNESYWLALFGGTVFIMMYKVDLTFQPVSLEEIGPESTDNSNKAT